MLSSEQSKIISYFLSAVKDKSVRHSYIVSGAKGLGKKHLANEMCLAFACEKGQACGFCPSCLSTKKGANPDVVSLLRNDGKEYPISEIRELISQVHKKPNGEYKLIVINDAHLLNQRCQNALLKTIEEPPSYAVFVFVCENKLSLLPTVRSRSLSLEHHPWKTDELKKAFPLGEDKEFLYLLSGGNPQTLLSSASDDEFAKIRNDAIGSFTHLMSSNDYGVYDALEIWLSHSDRIETMLDCLSLFLRDVMLFCFGQRESITNTDKLKDIQSIAQKLSKASALSLTELVSDFVAKRSKYDNTAMAIETMLMHIKEEIND